jgi:2EXR family
MDNTLSIVLSDEPRDILAMASAGRDEIEKRIREVKDRPDFVDFLVDQALHQSRYMIALRESNTSLQEQVAQLTAQLEASRLTHDLPRSTTTIKTTTFPLFSQLPPELRRKIWKHALPEPRVINVDYVQRTRSTAPSFVANHGPPTLLAVNREARAIALAQYEPAFRARTGPASDSRSSGFYFDFRRDTLCFATETTPVRIVFFLEDMPRADIARVRFLAVGSELPRELCKYITQFHGLEVFNLILSDPRSLGAVGAVTPRRKFGFAAVADRRSIWLVGSYWNHGLTSWGAMELNLRAAFEDERARCPECKIPVIEFVYAVSAREGCCRDCPGHVSGGG